MTQAYLDHIRVDALNQLEYWRDDMQKTAGEAEETGPLTGFFKENNPEEYRQYARGFDIAYDDLRQGDTDGAIAALTKLKSRFNENAIQSAEKAQHGIFKFLGKQERRAAIFSLLEGSLERQIHRIEKLKNPAP